MSAQIKAMQSPGLPPETPTEHDEAVYPCRGCGEVLEEGKAFELAGHRWHIDCFRCHTCGTMLDSDSSLLLLGESALICSNCTYSCTACGNKIEDLAILTGEQAFCASCFKCRNCKRKIENLRYARTSQGIFCMQCHESLMARRRKKSKPQARATSANSNGASRDKLLPALPPSIDGLAPETRSPSDSYSGTPTNRSPHPATRARRDESVNNGRNISPAGFEQYKEGLTLPSSTFNNNRISINSANDITEDDTYIPVTLDTMPNLLASRNQTLGTRSPELTRPGATDRGALASVVRDDFGDLITGSSGSRSTSSDRAAGRSRVSPHIAYQEKGRIPSSEMTDTIRRRAEAPAPEQPQTTRANEAFPQLHLGQLVPSADRDQFKLQDAPKPRRSSGSKGTSTVSSMAASPNMTLAGQTEGSPVLEQGISAFPSLHQSTESPALPPRGQQNGVQGSPRIPNVQPQRETSLNNHNVRKQAPPRKDFQRVDGNENVDNLRRFHDRKPSGSSPLARDISSRDLTISAPMTSDDIPPRSASRPSAPLSDRKDEFTAPRDAPIPPPHRHRPSDSVGSIQNERLQKDVSSPPTAFDNTGDFSVEDEMNRTLKGEDSQQPGILRKVSKAVRHGRSQSDKTPSIPSPIWKQQSRNGSVDISSPVIASGDIKEEFIQLKNKHKFAQQRIAELETRLLMMEEQANGTEDIKQVNTELREKRSTMAFLDTQREMVIQELEVMTDQLAKLKENDKPINLEELQSELLKDFTMNLQKVKDHLGVQIEDLMHKKNELTNEISSLIQMKDKGFQEYESLSTKNNQLNELNHQLVHNIQELYKQGREPSAAPNGLGIFTQSSKDRPLAAADGRSLISEPSQYSGETEVESNATIVSAPKVIDIRKAQPKKFNWKKGAKTVGKGFKGAFTGQNSTLKEEQFAEGMAYGDMAPGQNPIVVSTLPRAGTDQGRQPWPFLAPQGKGVPGKPGQPQRALSHGSLGSLPANEALFGADLTARCEFEKRVIPAIVTRCIEEVELRGLDTEGIYRKSGSASQVKVIQGGFEKDIAGPDISDVDLDIHAVTGTLKQYFRKLPVPLITPDCYDAMINSAKPDLEDAERVAMLRGVVQSLPKCHRDTLEFLIFHMARVVEREAENWMTPLNLAVVFAPTIMRPDTVEQEMTDAQLQRGSLQSLLKFNRDIFARDDSE